MQKYKLIVFMNDNSPCISLKTKDLKDTTNYLNNHYNWKYYNVYLYQKTPKSAVLRHNNYITRFYQNNQSIIKKQI